MFDELVRVESSGWKAHNGSSLTQRHKLRRFFLNYTTRASQSGLVRFAFLDVNGTSIAAQLMVEYLDRLWVLKIGYDEAWSRCSPGWLLMAEGQLFAIGRQGRVAVDDCGDRTDLRGALGLFGSEVLFQRLILEAAHPAE